jgi:dienelactone hydrolase
VHAAPTLPNLGEESNRGLYSPPVSQGRATSRVVILVGLLLAFRPLPAHAEGHAVAVTSPAPASLTAELYIPRGTGPFPAVILMHGCGGISPNVKEWAVWLRHEGYAAFMLDSFGGRGLKRLCAGSAQLTGSMRAPDVFAAASYLKTLPQIDANRLAAIGYSHGGWTLLTSATMERQHPDTRIRAFILFYPSCGGFTKLPGSAPILMLLGGKDDWTPAAPCEALAKSATAAGRSVTAIVYPNARHHFDGAEVRRLTIVADARGGRGATVDYDPRAHEDAEKQVRAFLAASLGK